MQKLIDAFLADPLNMAKRLALINYAWNHPMAVCTIDPNVIGQLRGQGVNL